MSTRTPFLSARDGYRDRPCDHCGQSYNDYHPEHHKCPPTVGAAQDALALAACRVFPDTVSPKPSNLSPEMSALWDAVAVLRAAERAAPFREAQQKALHTLVQDNLQKSLKKAKAGKKKP